MQVQLPNVLSCNSQHWISSFPLWLVQTIETGTKISGFDNWLKNGNPFLPELSGSPREFSNSTLHNGSMVPGYSGRLLGKSSRSKASLKTAGGHDVNRSTAFLEDKNEDLHADFIDEDSQLPSRISNPNHRRNNYSHWNDEETNAQTGSSLTLLRLMDKYARLMQKLEVVNVEFFQGICQLFGIFFHFIFENFCHIQHSGTGLSDSLSYRLRTALSRITQDCDQWIKPHLVSASFSPPASSNASFSISDVTPTSPPSSLPSTSFSLKCHPIKKDCNKYKWSCCSFASLCICSLRYFFVNKLC